MLFVPKWLQEWIRGGDTGTSSTTIAFVMIGAAPLLSRMAAPYDTSDVGRCIRLLDLAEQHGWRWRARLNEVADVCPEWKPLIPRWTEIEAAYYEDKTAQDAHNKSHYRNHKPIPPSRCWWLISTIRGHGDPYQHKKPHPFIEEKKSK